MFAKLKKKVEDLEGTDLHKLANSISFGATSVPEKSASNSTLKSLGTLSASGSTNSLSSMQSSVKPSDESDSVQVVEKKWRQKIVEAETEHRQKLQEVENEWRVKVMVHQHEKEQLSKDQDVLVQQKKKLEEELKEMRGYQEKCLKAEEDLDKLSKAKESESASLNLQLSNANVEVEDFKAKDDLMQEQLDKKDAEIKRLQLLVNEQRINEEPDETQTNLQDILNKSADIESQLKHAQESLVVKDAEIDRWKRQHDQVKNALDAMTQNWQDEKTLNMSLQDKLAQLSEEKNSFVVRNAELSQQMSLTKQQLQRCEKELEDVGVKASEMEKENRRIKHLLTDAEARDENSERVNQLRTQVAELEAGFTEKNKTIKLQQQRLADMKKMLQKELKGQNNEAVVSPDGLLSVSPAIARKNLSTPPPTKNSGGELEEVNFKYLKHVIFKFLTSREYEAQHLTRAVSTLLKLTAEEEKLLKETLEWKMSWFRSKPDLGSGQSALYIPPTH